MWEVGDLIEFNGEIYTIGDINANRHNTRVVYRLDRKFEPSVELVLRKRI
jgi:hypothetical protein